MALRGSVCAFTVPAPSSQHQNVNSTWSTSLKGNTETDVSGVRLNILATYLRTSLRPLENCDFHPELQGDYGYLVAQTKFPAPLLP